ncbi:relaxase, partial [Klebsiella pneumoniae]
PLFREDLIKLNTIAREARLLCHYRIDTAEQLSVLQEDLKDRMEMLSDKRKTLRLKSRSIREEGGISEARAEIKGLTGQ